jgi:hypothetical protein
MFPLVLFHKAFELPMKNVESPPVLSARKGPSATPVNCSTEAFQLIVGIVQPQKPTALSIRMSIFTVVLIGFGLGPTVMFEVLVDPDCTALITAFERLLSLNVDDAVCNKSARVLVEWQEAERRFRLASAVSLALLLETRITDNKKNVLIAVDKISVFFIFILL